MRRRWSLRLVALALVLAAPAPALAEGGDPAAAAALFQEGREAAKRGDFATACPKLDQSYRLDPAVGTLLNLADCQEHLGKTATAWALFQQAVEHLTKGDDRMAIAKKRVAELEGRLSRLEVTLAPGAPSGTKVTRDGAEVSNLGTAAPIDPGAHVLVVTAPGREDRRTEVNVVEAQVARVTVRVGDVTAVAVAPPPAEGMSRLRLAGIVVGSAGVVGLITAVATGLALPSKQKTVAAHCGPPDHPVNLCDATGFQAAQAGKGLAAANTAAWALGAVATAGGVTLVIVGRNKPAATDAAIKVTALPGGAGALFQGHF